MRIRIVSYTVRGQEIARRVADVLKEHTVETYARYPDGRDLPLTVGAAEWARDGFENADALVFCCASGIAVRAIAPWVKSKTTDPAVLVIDECGRFVIPLLSGHIGGANALANRLSDALGATAVVTTATDVNHLFAVDVFATKNRLRISDMVLCKAVSAALLRGEPVGFTSDVPIAGELPNGLTYEKTPLGVAVANVSDDPPFPRTLFLTPQRYCVGIGCRKGKDADELWNFVHEQLCAANVSADALFCIASIDLKRDEAGILTLAKRLNVPFQTYSGEELNRVKGDFTPSGFVLSQTGVDNVCERAAVLASGGTLTVKKTARDGMTFALAKREEAIAFV